MHEKVSIVTMRTRLVRSASVGLLALALLLFSHAASATGTTVAPAYIRLSISPNKPTDTAAIALRNDYDVKLSYDLSLVDVDIETGALTPLDLASDLTKSLLSISESSVTLQPKQSVNVSVYAKNVDTASPGGHYAALLIKPVDQTKKSRVTQGISVGILVAKEDGMVRKLTIEDPSAMKWLINWPKQEKLAFKNEGNIELVPRGFVSYSRAGKEYKKTMFNEVSLPIFAGKTKTFSVEHKQFGFMWPGRYLRTVSYRYDGQTEQSFTKTAVWYLPWWSILTLVVAILIGARIIKSRRVSKKSKTFEIVRLPKTSTVNKKGKTRRIQIENEIKKVPSGQSTKKARVVSEFGSTKGIK